MVDNNETLSMRPCTMASNVQLSQYANIWIITNKHRTDYDDCINANILLSRIIWFGICIIILHYSLHHFIIENQCKFFFGNKYLLCDKNDSEKSI